MPPACRSRTVVSGPGENLARNLNIIERDRARAADLNFLVSFAGNQHNVSRLGLANCNCDGGLPVGLDCVLGSCPFQASQGIVDDGARIFAARIVGSKDNEITAVSRGLAHQGTLGAVAISTAAEQSDNPSCQPGLRDEFPGYGRQITEGVIGVGIIHNHRKRLAAINTLETPGNAVEVRDSLRDRLALRTTSISRCGCRQYVVEINFPDEGGPDGNCLLRSYQIEACSTERDSDFLGMKIPPRPAIGKNL